MRLRTSSEGIIAHVSSFVSLNEINQLQKIVINDSLFKLFRTKHNPESVSFEKKQMSLFQLTARENYTGKQDKMYSAASAFLSVILIQQVSLVSITIKFVSKSSVLPRARSRAAPLGL